jgi:hypothetical protein
MNQSLGPNGEQLHAISHLCNDWRVTYIVGLMIGPGASSAGLLTRRPTWSALISKHSFKTSSARSTLVTINIKES